MIQHKFSPMFVNNLNMVNVVSNVSDVHEEPCWKKFDGKKIAYHKS